ncbi:MAG: hypothetical protein HY986_02145 [Candidatus Melainabacteria bacterium]|nr:hypothetical protein [Candidatus Melainabacteria bacterium]
MQTLVSEIVGKIEKEERIMAGAVLSDLTSDQRLVKLSLYAYLLELSRSLLSVPEEKVRETGFELPLFGQICSPAVWGFVFAELQAMVKSPQSVEFEVDLSGPNVLEFRGLTYLELLDLANRLVDREITLRTDKSTALLEQAR